MPRPKQNSVPCMRESVSIFLKLRQVVLHFYVKMSANAKGSAVFLKHYSFNRSRTESECFRTLRLLMIGMFHKLAVNDGPEVTWFEKVRIEATTFVKLTDRLPAKMGSMTKDALSGSFGRRSLAANNALHVEPIQI